MKKKHWQSDLLRLFRAQGQPYVWTFEIHDEGGPNHMRWYFANEVGECGPFWRQGNKP